MRLKTVYRYLIFLANGCDPVLMGSWSDLVLTKLVSMFNDD
jgi:hypothetical protein